MSNHDHAFQFAALRYTHDVITQEFFNIGVVLYSRSSRYIRAIVETKYKRISDAFPGFNGEHYRAVARRIQAQFDQLQDAIGPRLEGGADQPRLFEDLPEQIEPMLARVLQHDNSTFTFGGIGGGLCPDLDTRLEELYARIVETYIEREDQPSRSDTQVWQVYRRALDKRNLMQHLNSVTITTPTYAYEFGHAWKNDRWHPLEPLSFDLQRDTSILDKANRWIGRIRALSTNKEMGSLFILMGLPKKRDLRAAYENALQNLRRETIDRVPLHIYEEDEAEEFSERLRQLIEQHP